MNHCVIRRLRVRSGKCSSPDAISCRGDRSRSGGSDLETDREATGHFGSPLGRTHEMTTGAESVLGCVRSLWRSSRSTRRQRHPRGFVGASRAHRNGAAGGAVVRRRDIAGTVVQPSPAALSRAARRGRGASVDRRRAPSASRARSRGRIVIGRRGAAGSARCGRFGVGGGRRLLRARSGNPAIRCPRLTTGTGAEGLVLQRDS